MKIKNLFLNLHNNYAKAEKESRTILKKIKPKVTSIPEALKIHQLQTNDFYPKHDLSYISKITKKYKIPSEKLNKFCKKTKKAEEELLKVKKEFEKIGLRKVMFGLRSIFYAEYKKENFVIIEKQGKKQELKVKVFKYHPHSRWKHTPAFKVMAKDIQKKLRTLLNQKVITQNK